MIPPLYDLSDIKKRKIKQHERLAHAVISPDLVFILTYVIYKVNNRYFIIILCITISASIKTAKIREADFDTCRCADT